MRGKTLYQNIPLNCNPHDFIHLLTGLVIKLCDERSIKVDEERLVGVYYQPLLSLDDKFGKI